MKQYKLRNGRVITEADLDDFYRINTFCTFSEEAYQNWKAERIAAGVIAEIPPVKITELTGKAYDQAIDNIIHHLNVLGWRWDYEDNRRDAHDFAEMNNVEFDTDGNFAID